jgi:hypothetical protein
MVVADVAPVVADAGFGVMTIVVVPFRATTFTWSL